MKKLSGIFAVSMIAIMTAGAARADIAATTYVDTEVGKRVAIDQGTTNASKAVVTDAKGQVTVGQVAKGMLADDVQTSLGKADTALQAADIAGKVDVDQTVANKDKAVITDATGQITTGKIASGMIADDAVTTVKIKDANVTAAKLAADAVTTAKITDKNVTKAKLADDVQTSLGKADTALQAADISGKVDVDQKVENKDKAVITDATGQITTGKIASGMIADDAVTTVKIKDANVTAAKLAADAVTTVKIKDANVTAAKLAADAVTTAKITDKNVTKAKLADDVQTSLGKADTALQAADIEGKQDKLTTDETIAQLAKGTSDATKVGNYALTLKVAEGGAKTLVWEYIGR